MDTEIEFLDSGAPVFTPQPLPSGLGFPRTVILVLMVLVALGEAVLMAGAALHVF